MAEPRQNPFRRRKEGDLLHWFWSPLDQRFATQIAKSPAFLGSVEKPGGRMVKREEQAGLASGMLGTVLTELVFPKALDSGEAAGIPHTRGENQDQGFLLLWEGTIQHGDQQ